VNRLLPLLGAACVAGLLAAAPRDSYQTRGDRLARLGWLAGCWELRAGERVTLEMWMPPAGHLMLGASRTTGGGALREYEQLRLEAPNDSELIYTAIPSGQRETSFRSTAISDSGFTVENPAHDFPRRIIYRRRGADSLVARIEGPGPNGARGIDFSMRRITCTTWPDRT
jgi:hypothetical protein